MKLSKKQQKFALLVIACIIILWGAYQMGYTVFGKQPDYDGENPETGGPAMPTISPTFDGENIAQQFYYNLDGSTDFDVFMDTCDMILALSNDELVITWNEYASLYGDTDYPTMRSNIMAEDLSIFLWMYPLSGIGKLSDATSARDQVTMRFDLLNLP